MPWKSSFWDCGVEFPLLVYVDGEALFSANTNGTGGFQSLIIDMQDRVDDGEIELDEDDVDRILRCAYCYGNGGWEGQLTSIFPSEVFELSQHHYCNT